MYMIGPLKIGWFYHVLDGFRDQNQKLLGQLVASRRRWELDAVAYGTVALALATCPNGKFWVPTGSSWKTNSLLWKMAIELVDFPIENGDFL